MADRGPEDWAALRARVRAQLAEFKAQDAQRKAAKRERRLKRLEGPVPGRLFPLVRGAILRLLSEAGPCSDASLVDAYIEQCDVRGWPVVVPGTIKQARLQLVKRSRVEAIGTTRNPATGRTVTLWGLVDPVGRPGTPVPEPMWDDE